jgi:uncharacterized protein (UPF0333 family)
MMKNKKGQVVFYTLMLSVVVVVLALAMTPVVKQVVDNSTGEDTDTQQGMSCNNSTISDFRKAQCVLTDLTTPFFLYGMLAIALIIIGARVIFGGTVQ